MTSQHLAGFRIQPTALKMESVLEAFRNFLNRAMANPPAPDPRLSKQQRVERASRFGDTSPYEVAARLGLDWTPEDMAEWERTHERCEGCGEWITREQGFCSCDDVKAW